MCCVLSDLFVSRVLDCTLLFALILLARRVQVSALRSRACFMPHELESGLTPYTYIHILYALAYFALRVHAFAGLHGCW